ncbi:hypothetical protein [Mycobacterium parmense]|uniref:Uncharacterized protein n=1 Tax=Mycobacterium parmense TaxID=185642 RepID=A0A7I7YWR4_9MYCO|nr:hypothetical protein [Mycobacterium parmense]MCV7351113.1 hypothetical protein [Mycobacterium parmense]ORW60673.1 hypothetical protein AWC20_06820 [Mycobacterium parmense]BBZ45443.1 hypothetical protein MPRM_27240 [Mycobacterium parmense]
MQSDNHIRKVLESDELMSRLAAVEHERWAHWQQYVHDHGERRDDGSLVVPAELVARWDAQIATSYSDLSKEEQQSDQDQVRRYLPIIVDALTREG